MNWTGGHLHRHSKTNSNTLLKSQKRHFAKARLPAQSTSSPSRPLISIHGQHQPDFPISQRVTSNPIRKQHAGLDKLPQNKSQNPGQQRSRAILRTDIPSEKKQQHSLQNKWCGLNHLFKENLLSQRDWAGLNKTRPMKSLRYPEKANLVDAQARLALPQMREQPFKAAELSLSSYSHSRMSSGQMGQNSILQGTSSTMEARASRLPPPQARSVSDLAEYWPVDPAREYTTLGRCVPEPEFYWNHNPQVGQEERIHEPLSPTDIHSRRLIPLNQVLGLRTFDEVMELSSSLAREKKHPSADIFRPLEDFVRKSSYQTDEFCSVGCPDCHSSHFLDQNGHHSVQDPRPVSDRSPQPDAFSRALIRHSAEESSSPPQMLLPFAFPSQQPQGCRETLPHLPPLSTYRPRKGMYYCQIADRKNRQLPSKNQNCATEAQVDPIFERFLPSSPSSGYLDVRHGQKALNPSMKRKASDDQFSSSCRAKTTAASGLLSSDVPYSETKSLCSLNSMPLTSNANTFWGGKSTVTTMSSSEDETLSEF